MLLERVPVQFSLRETIKCVRKVELFRLSCTSLVNHAWKDKFLLDFFHALGLNLCLCKVH